MSKIDFVPAIGEQLNSVWRRKLMYNDKFDMKFFTKQSHFEHNIALQSCFYGMEGVGKSAKTTFRDLIGYPKDKILVTDSGGFQIATFKIRGKVCPITPIDSLRWQEANGDIGMNLDIPPTLNSVPTIHEFDAALNESVKNFELFEKKRKNYDMKLYNVLHGETLELMERWYSKVKNFNFDGWAVGMKPPWDSMIQAMGFCFLYEKGEFDKASNYGVHFFGTSGKHVVPTLAYAASKLKKEIVTYDSSSYNIGSIYRTYYNPFDIGPSLSFGRKFDREDDKKEAEENPEYYTDFTGTKHKKLIGDVGENPNITSLPCMCPVCRSIKDIEDLNKKDIFAGTLISLHNMYQYIHYNNVLSSLVNCEDKFKEYLKSINTNIKTLKSIEFIDFAMKKGVKEATIKFHEYLVPQELNTKRQAKIYGF